MSYVNAKMHQIRFPLGLPRPAEKAHIGYNKSPDLLAGFKGILLLRGGRTGAGKGREGKGE